MSKKKASSSSSLPHHLLIELDEADQLLERKKTDQARQILDELDRQRPNQPAILSLLVNASYDQNDMRAYEWAIYRLARLDHHEPDLLVGLGGAYLEHVRPGLAIRTFEHFLQRWPDHPRSANIRQTVAELRAPLRQGMDKLAWPEEESIDMAAQHEEVCFFLEHGQLQQGRQAAEKLLKRGPPIDHPNR